MKSVSIPLILAVLTANAATAREPQGHRPPPPVPPLLALFDTDHDGELSAEEIRDAAAALGKLDQNGDGRITRDEMRPPRPDAKGEAPEGPPPGNLPPPPPPMIAALDADEDGTLSGEELTNAPESLKQLDHDGDGELSPEELHPHGPPPPRGEGQGGGRRPQGPPPPDADVE